MERDVERALVKGIEALGGKAFKFVSPGNAGVPDRLVCLPGGRIVFVELKEVGGRVSGLQLSQITRLSRLGHKVRVLKGRAEVDAFLAEIGGDADEAGYA
jgi:hypothetical protein